MLMGQDPSSGTVEQRTEVGDVELQHLGCARGWPIPPQAVDKAVDRDGAADLQREHGENRPLLAGAQLDGPVVDVELDGPKQAQIHRPATLRLVDRRVNRA